MTWLLWGCVVERDDWTRPEIDQAFDYVIDRTRLVGLRVAPAVVPDGGTITLDALVLSPFDTAPIALHVCALDPATSTAIRVTDPACFGVPDLVTDLGPAPTTVVAPAFDQLTDRADCTFVAGAALPEPCRLTFPLLATAQAPDAEARASEPFDVIVGLPAAVEPLLDASELVLEAPAQVTAGADLDLAVVWTPASASPIEGAEATWYIDAGALDRLRVTRLEPEPMAWRAENRWRIPDDAQGPLRVAVVVDVETVQVGSVEPFERRERAWQVATVEVTP